MGLCCSLPRTRHSRHSRDASVNISVCARAVGKSAIAMGELPDLCMWVARAPMTVSNNGQVIKAWPLYQAKGQASGHGRFLNQTADCQFHIVPRKETITSQAKLFLKGWRSAGRFSKAGQPQRPFYQRQWPLTPDGRFIKANGRFIKAL